MDVRVYNSVTKVDEEMWDEIVTKNRLICRHKYLRAIEESQINDCQYYYPVAYEGGRIVAHTSVYFISTEVDTFARGFTKEIISLIRKRWRGFFILRSLECGTPVALGSTISFRDGIDRIRVLKRVCHEIENLARDFRVGVVVFRDFYDEELRLFDDLAELGYTRIHNLPNSKIKIRWRTFDEYLNAMRSHYKWKIIKRMRKCYREDISVQVKRNFSEYADKLEELWTNIYRHATEYRRERLTADFFRNIDICLGDRSAVILIKKNNILIGFTLLLFDDTTLIPLFSGVDYTYNKEYCIYFNLLYKIVEVGITEGKKEIDMGITTLVPKKDIGAEVYTLNMYMKHFNPLLNKILPKVFDVMTPQDNTGPRHVFKRKEQKNKYEDITILQEVKALSNHAR